MVHRAYLSLQAADVSVYSDDHLFGLLAQKLPFPVEPTQSTAWRYQINHLRVLAADLPDAHFFMEFLIPRMGRRADLIVIFAGVIFVVEYKFGARNFDRAGLEQVYGYGLDLKHFHETSHTLPIVPILVATEAGSVDNQFPDWEVDGLAKPLRLNPFQVSMVIYKTAIDAAKPFLEPATWFTGRYRPTPTIIEAAQALYRGHDVAEISRSEAGAENLTCTTDYIMRVIEFAKRTQTKIVCFITGVPGSGKTLAGLNLATARQRAHSDEHAVFLSGNGPLVEVLRAALTLDLKSKRYKVSCVTPKLKKDIRPSAFIQNIHHFRDDALINTMPPIEKVAIFDEAQRAWNAEQTSDFMQKKKGQSGFSMSEPEFLLSVMNRHESWCAIICLVGDGQEINTGEAGIEEWLRAIQGSFPHWQVHLPHTLINSITIKEKVFAKELHLATSIRSFRAERLSDFVGHVIEGDATAAAKIKRQLLNYPLLITRDLEAARRWLRRQRRGNERTGLLASSNAARLKPHGIFVKAKIEPSKWFLASPDDVRSSDALEDAATEFDVQGLELDWACLCWDGNLRRGSTWEYWRFRGSRWETINDSARRAYLANSYRVLLTRARQGLVVFVPPGSKQDLTRPIPLYDEIYDFLRICGFELL